MEHLSRNTKNERLIYLIEQIKKENRQLLSNELKGFFDGLFTIISGILSTIIASILVKYLKIDNDEIKFKILSIFLFIIILLLCWYCIVVYFRPLIEKKIKSRVNIEPKEYAEVVMEFNTTIMEKISEINESLCVALETNDEQCKMLNFILSFYKWQSVIEFLNTHLVIEKRDIRKFGTQINAKTLDVNFNEYEISAVIFVLRNIDKNINLLLNHKLIKALKGYDLIINDFKYIAQKQEKIFHILD